jgi:hypothetical protein
MVGGGGGGGGGGVGGGGGIVHGLEFLQAQRFGLSRDSSVGIATGYGLDDQGEREFESL